ncbi:MAG: 4-(cytidine 5'-diphospho)-2-C-methyl-D-erythritol kinase [Mariprofundales bacterium]|nr:4-(cytidine 5'-diphospho)-2-C-methyl-D-erythritol kinase [Mariprofundales bacterium]
MTTQILPAPAKVNLFLRVTALLTNGYHTLDTAFAFVDVADHLHFTPADRLHITCSRPHLNGEDNLVHQLLQAVREKFRIRQGLEIFIDKQLPEQAGLGGGSSDAATALIAANRIWGLGLTRQQMIALSTPFGADIPCFLYGQASRAQGIGEQLQPWDSPLPSGFVLLAYPGTGLSTNAVFSHLDTTLTPSKGADSVRALSEPTIGCNDLQAHACALLPAVSTLLTAMQQGAKHAWMSGSGSCCVALFDQRASAETMAARLQHDGLAPWVHIGRLLAQHPAFDSYNDVA